MRVLITGATGFLGSALARAHLTDGDEVVAVGHRQPLPAELAGRVSCLVEEELERADGPAWPRVDVVYHCAAMMAGHEGEPYGRFYRINVLGTARVLRSARAAQARRIVHVSTTGVLGPTRGRASESAPYGRHLTAYERSKRQAEAIVLAAMAQGLPATIVRPAQLYGPGMRHLWPQLVRGIRAGRAVVLGAGRAQIHLTHVEDAVQGVRLAAASGRAAGQIYHVAAEAPVTARHMIESLAAACGAPPPRTLPYGPVLAAAAGASVWPLALRPEPLRRLTVHNVQLFARDRAYAIDKARAELGYEPRRRWDQDVDALAASYAPPPRGEPPAGRPAALPQAGAVACHM
jgi:nucleoside-diphosphate-sugar epimerase